MVKRPPKRWFRSCVRKVRARGKARDPAAVCGAQWYHKMSKKAKRKATNRSRVKVSS